MEDKTKNIFISHVHEDDEILQGMKDLLSGKGYTVRDSSVNASNPNDAHSPDYIKNSILAPRINWAGVMVVLITSKTKESTWVDWEIEYANRKEKRIVGVWAQGERECTVPDSLDKYADAVVGWQAESIMDAIIGRTNNWYNQDGSERPPRDISRFNCGA